jgi:hypothetical protein
MHVANETEPKEKGEPCPVKHLASTYLIKVDMTPLTKRFMRANFLLLLRQTLQYTKTFLSAHVSFDQTQNLDKKENSAGSGNHPPHLLRKRTRLNPPDLMPSTAQPQCKCKCQRLTQLIAQPTTHV